MVNLCSSEKMSPLNHIRCSMKYIDIHLPCDHRVLKFFGTLVFGTIQVIYKNGVDIICMTTAVCRDFQMKIQLIMISTNLICLKSLFIEFN
jgi:hypothetical protein